jgi:hypothetical protein
MYLYLVSTPAQPWQVHDTTLATIITSLLTILFTNGSQSNVDIAAQKLKVNLALALSSSPVFFFLNRELFELRENYLLNLKTVLFI